MTKLLVGIDIGSTTTKIVVMEQKNEELEPEKNLFPIIYSDYQRHNAAQLQSVKDALEKLKAHLVKNDVTESNLSTAKIRLCLTGSGAKILAESMEVPFVQEVVANSIALKKEYNDVGTAIELGGQDAKIIFFNKDKSGQTNVSDMRMNGSCAGGTGAFIDEVASILKTPIEEFDALASRGTAVLLLSSETASCRRILWPVCAVRLLKTYLQKLFVFPIWKVWAIELWCRAELSKTMRFFALWSSTRGAR